MSGGETERRQMRKRNEGSDGGLKGIEDEEGNAAFVGMKRGEDECHRGKR